MDQLLDQEIMKPIVHVDGSKDDNQQKNNDIEELSRIEGEIINIVAESTAIFKCQHKNEPDLSVDEKKIIASDLLHKNPVQFLSRFGKFLRIDLLKYFETADDNYEVTYYINKLRRYFDNASKEVDKKNRRYEALKVLIEEGEYFSETAMMRRNPLLYNNLVGQYLTDEQKRCRDSADTDNDTFVDVLMRGIDRDQVEKLMKRQEDAENEVTEENDSDSDSDEGCKFKVRPDFPKNNIRWGEMSDDGNISQSKPKRVNTGSKDDPDQMKTTTTENKFKGKKKITNINEINILRQEFVTHMYQNFLNGYDDDFDYSTVDDNEAYDNVDLRTQDEEEKYFDSESPELINSPSVKQSQDDSEDELDKYMNFLKEETNISQDPS